MKKRPFLLMGTLLLAVIFCVVPGLYAQSAKSAQDINDIGEIAGNYDDVSGSIASPTSPVPAVPTFTQWGIMGFALLLSVGGICLIRHKKSII